jgi:hypothetical protein
VIHNTVRISIYTQQASVGDDNCAECESVFLDEVDPAKVSGDGTDYATVEEYIETLPEILAGLACGCADPSKELIAQFSVVQSVAGPDGAWSVEITILPVADNNPEADTPADVMERLKTNSKDDDAKETTGFNFSTNRPKHLPSVAKSESAGSDDFPLLPVLLGISGFLLLLIAVYCLRRQIQKRYELKSTASTVKMRSVVRVGADGSVRVHKMQMDTATNCESTPPPVDDLNDINVPDASAPV